MNEISFPQLVLISDRFPRFQESDKKDKGNLKDLPEDENAAAQILERDFGGKQI